MLSFALIICFASAGIDQDNPPIGAYYPGLSFGGTDSGIQIEMYYDLTCSACAALHPNFTLFLDMPFLNKTVKDVVQINYAFIPLPYHHGAYAVTKLTAYIIDKCIVDPSSCKLLDYIDFCFQY